MKECLVPLLDSKMNPGRSSRNMVVCCWPSELCMCTSASFFETNDQLPTISRVGPGFERIGIELLVDLTAARALCNFSRNSPRFSENHIFTYSKRPISLRSGIRNIHIPFLPVYAIWETLKKRCCNFVCQMKCAPNCFSVTLNSPTHRKFISLNVGNHGFKTFFDKGYLIGQPLGFHSLGYIL